jgi:signal transduction histidine kinase/CheY-like chemotaxis protein
MRQWLTRPDRHFFGGLAIVLMAGAIALLTLSFARSAIWTHRGEIRERAVITVSQHALVFRDRVARQLLSIEAVLRTMGHAWESDPAHFDLQVWQQTAIGTLGLSQDLMLVDENGIVHRSTIPEAVGSSAARDDFFHALATGGSSETALYVGRATIGRFMRQWHMNVAVPLRHADGSFAGAIVTDYRLAAITAMLSQGNLGAGGMLALVGVNDGALRAQAGPGAAEPDTRITGSAMFAALQGGDGFWTGPSAPDGIIRMLAFRRVPNRDLVVVAGMDETEVMAPAAAWERDAKLFTAGIIALLCVLVFLLVRGLVVGRRRQSEAARDRAVLAAANAQLEVAKAYADAKAAQLQATLAGMTDGVSMIDGHMCLMEWNARFPDIAGVPAEILRVGMPLEEVLLAQALGGQFGIVDPKPEVARRMDALRSGIAPRQVERRRPDGRVVELRRNRLPDGGFVTLYADITERKRAEEVLRDARATADAANAAKSRFVAIVSHEIRTPLNALLNTLRLLAEGPLGSSEAALVDNARESGEALLELLNDILDISSMEAGQLTLRSSVFALRPLIESAVELFQTQAKARGITLRGDIGADLPSELFTDPGRVRQVLLNLISNAVKFGRPGEVTVQARRLAEGPCEPAMLHLSVQNVGPVIPEQERARLFQPFSRLDTEELEPPLGTGLGLAICRHLVGMMGGTIGCAPWSGADGQQGNEFWVRLPIVNPPSGGMRPAQTLARRVLPRTRILFVEDVAVNQRVTAMLLRRAGHLVDVAGDGLAAVEAVRHNPYDVVLMDFFLPGLSGPEAVERIRAMRGLFDTLPILALTASLSPEDEAVAHQAGMDGLIGKPVGLEQLLAAIARHVWRGVPNRTLDRQTVRVAPDPGTILSWRRLEELRSNLPADTLSTMMEECLDDLEVRLHALRHALEEGSAEEVAAQTHAMAGMAAGYGMSGLETRLRALAKPEGRAGHSPAELGSEMEAMLRETARALRAMMQKEVAQTSSLMYH